MPTPTTLRTALFGASASVPARATRRGRKVSVAQAMLVLSMVTMTACSDSLTGIDRVIDREAMEAVMPAVTDGRMRLANGIDNVSVRQKLVIGISTLEFALKRDDVIGARAEVKKASELLATYGQTGSNVRNPDVSAIVLMLNAVSTVLDNSSASQ
jgi:hypothetical protein